MVTKNTQPENVELDWGSFKGGSVDALVHWNITESTGTTEDGQTYPQWQYDEARIRIPLPAHARSQETAQAYANARYQALLMLAGADVIPTKITDLEAAVLDLAGAMLV
jgi:hypothetical protein